MDLKPNEGKELEIEVEGVKYARYPIRTHIIKDTDNIIKVVRRYAGKYLEPGDILFISEKIVAISQGRAFPIADIHPTKMAKFLAKYVLKTPYGIGIGSPWTMQLAIDEVGLPRIFLGALVAILTKPFGIRGMFYRVVGKGVSAIDGPCDYTLPPYNKYAKLAPKDPGLVARELKKEFGNEFVIIDANDLGVDVLGRSSDSIQKKLAQKIFKDNPLGQTNEQTPLCIVRELS